MTKIKELQNKTTEDLINLLRDRELKIVQLSKMLNQIRNITNRKFNNTRLIFDKEAQKK